MAKIVAVAAFIGLMVLLWFAFVYSQIQTEKKTISSIGSHTGENYGQSSIFILDKTSGKAIPHATLLFRSIAACNLGVGVKIPFIGKSASSCSEPHESLKTTNELGEFTMTETLGDEVVGKAPGYLESQPVGIWDIDSIPFMKYKEKISLELIPESLRIKTESEAYARAKETPEYQSRPTIVNDGVTFDGRIWRVKFIESKSVCDFYQPENPKCALFIELDAKTGEIVLTGP